MNHAIALAGSAEPEVGEERVPAGSNAMDVHAALGLIARHVAFIHAGRRSGRNRLALDLVDADIDRVLASAGMSRRVDDRGDEWAELDGAPMAWLGHRSELSRSAVHP